MNRVVRGAGLEPAQYCYRQDLNLVRLPISPPAQKNQGPSLPTRHVGRNGDGGTLEIG